MDLQGNHWVLELPDLIRLNQLVRHRIDFNDFSEWYVSLELPQKRALTNALAEYAYQAGVKEETLTEAFELSGLTDSPVAAKLLVYHRKKYPDNFGIYSWIMEALEVELYTIFRLMVFLFGVAEGRVYRVESPQHCNHWWHRNLLDERVVQDLLQNPRYYLTSMKDDELPE